MNQNHEPKTEPIPMNPNVAFSREALQHRLAAFAAEHGGSEAESRDAITIPIRDDSEGGTHIPVAPRDYTEEEKRQLAGSEIRAQLRARPRPSWMAYRDGKRDEAR